MEHLDLVLKTLRDSEKPLRPGDIAKKSGIDSKEVSKAIKELKTQEQIYSPKNCFYAVKE